MYMRKVLVIVTKLSVYAFLFIKSISTLFVITPSKQNTEKFQLRIAPYGEIFGTKPALSNFD